ncbi:MAG: 2-C-methyl-D-erythritol 2,4-cyclodiphosphate synthase [Armatimonadota bacterium]|nr:2-C-methyl-D-erythritol 2,4-cyclodiphosphate synthase [Armatimonadota bacterium]
MMESRVGIGYDSHRLVAGRPLILGGIEIPFERGLHGHSDGDVLLHAIGDALLGAAGLPDIGQLFPDTAPEWKDADSWHLLRDIGRRVVQSGWRIGNVDAVLIAERPKIAPHTARMKERIAAALEIDVASVNVRGKTAEGLGALGAGEGMAAHAVCLLFAKEAETANCGMRIAE